MATAAIAHPLPRADCSTTGPIIARNASTTSRGLPSGIGLDTHEARAAFIRAATEIVDRLTVEGHDRDNTWVNILNAPSGGWGIGGVTYTGEDLLKAAGATA